MINANSMFKFFNRVSRGLEVNTSLMLYKSLIRSIADYGSYIFIPTRGDNRLKIERAKYMGLRTALGYRNSTPTNVITAESKVMTMADRAGYLARNTLTKIIAYGGLSIKDTINKYINEENKYRYKIPWKMPSILSEAWKECNKHVNTLATAENFEVFINDFWTITNNVKIDEENGKRYKIDFSNNEITTFFKKQHNLQDNLTVIYTDGSKKDVSMSVDSAYYIEKEEMVFTMSLDKNASIFTAEACAIARALAWIHETDNYEDIIIFTDSFSVIHALKNNCINVYKNPYIVEIRKMYFLLINEKQPTRKIVFAWIPAHMDIKGNEIADSNAKEATNQIPNNSLKIPITDLRETFRNNMFKKTNELKKQFKFKGKKYYEKFYNESVRYPWFAGIDFPRKFVTTFNRIRSDHYNLNESLARKEYIASPRCECGHEVEDINHFVFTCNIYDEIRFNFNLNHKLNMIGASSPDCVWHWLNKEEIKTLKVVYDFIVRTGRII